MAVEKKEVSVFVDKKMVDYIDKRIHDEEYISRNDFVVSAVRFHQQRMKGLIAQYMYNAEHLIKESGFVRGTSEFSDRMLDRHSEKLVRISFDLFGFGLESFSEGRGSHLVRLGVRIPNGLMETWNLYNMYIFPRMELPDYIRSCLAIYVEALNEDLIIEDAFKCYNDPDKTADKCEFLHALICEIVGNRYGYIINKPTNEGGRQ